MLHTKFHGNRPAGSRVGFLKGYYPIWRGGHLVHVTSTMSSTFHFPVPEIFHTKFHS